MSNLFINLVPGVIADVFQYFICPDDCLLFPNLSWVRLRRSIDAIYRRVLCCLILAIGGTPSNAIITFPAGFSDIMSSEILIHVKSINIDSNS